jgi:uncharacterized delta-60 repeat protein
MLDSFHKNLPFFEFKLKNTISPPIMKKLFLILIFILCLVPSFAQITDSTFNAPVPVRPAKVKCIKVLSDGKILIGGNISFFKSKEVNNIIRMNTDNTLDTTFSFKGNKELIIKKIELQSSGDLIVFAQDYYSLLDVLGTGTHILRLDESGSIKNVVDTLLNITSVSIQSDNKVIVGGGDSQSGFLYRLNSDLTRDNDFKNNNTFNNIVSCVGTYGSFVYAGGPFSKVNGNIKNDIARFKSDGTIDAAFDIGSGTTDNIGSLEFQADGKILIGATLINYFNGTLYQTLVRLNTNGTVDTGFHPPKLYGPTSDIVVSGSSIYFAVNYILNSSQSYIIRLKSDGTLDGGFHPFLLDEAGFSDLIIAKTENAIIFNNSTTTGNIYGLSAADLSGKLVRSFAPETGRLGKVVIADYFNGKLVTAGDFIRMNELFTYGVALIDKYGVIDQSFLLHQNLGSVKQVKILDNLHLLINTQTNFFMLNNKAEIDSAFNFKPFKTLYEVMKFITLKSGKIIVCNGNSVFQLNSDGTEDPAFSSGTGIGNMYTSVFDFDIQDNKIIYGSEFDSFNGVSATRLIRLKSDGSVDTSFNIGTGPDNSVSLVKVLNSGEMIIGGFFNHFNGIAVPNRIVKLSRDGVVDLNFIKNQKLQGFQNGINVLGSKVEVIDSMIFVKGDFSVAKFSTSGNIYNEFQLPENVRQINDIVTAKDTTTVPGGKKSQNLDIINSYLYAFGSFTESGRSVPKSMIKVSVGSNSASGLPFIYVAEKSIHLSSAEGSNGKISLLSNENWNISCDKQWITFNQSAGTGNAIIQISTKNNSNVNQRTATITITGKDGKFQTITVLQDSFITGINDVDGQKILIYPNPVKDKLNILFQDPGTMLTYTVFSSSGQPLFTSKITNNITEVNMSRFPNGLYFIKIIKSNHQVITKKIIKS